MSKYLQKTRFHQKLEFSAAGVIGTEPYILDGEGRFRVSVENAGASNTLVIEAKLFDESSFTILETVTGNSSKIVNVSTWDQVRFRVDNYDSSPGIAIISGFYTLAIDEPVEVEGTLTVTTGALDTPTISNIIVNTANTEQSIVLPSTTKRFSFRVRNSGAQAKLSYVSGQSGTNFWSVNPGSVYSQDGLNLNSTLTLYFQLTKGSQVVEILYWE